MACAPCSASQTCSGGSCAAASDGGCVSTGPAGLSGSNGTAWGINNSGQIVGGAGAPYWASPTAALVLLSGGSFPFVAAYGINNRAQIVGDAYSSNMYSQPTAALYWSSPTAVPMQLQSDTSGRGVAWAINDNGEIAGGDGYLLAYYWTSLSSAPTSLPNGGFAGAGIVATGINNVHQIVGYIDDPHGSNTALFWSSPTSNPVALPSGGQSGPKAFGINNLGQIVGTDFGQRIALIWPSATSAPSLLPKGAYLDVSAYSINDKGQVVGFGASITLTQPVYWQICP
jgi:uncharacterized membrane protein